MGKTLVLLVLSKTKDLMKGSIDAAFSYGEFPRALLLVPASSSTRLWQGVIDALRRGEEAGKGCDEETMRAAREALESMNDAKLKEVKEVARAYLDLREDLFRERKYCHSVRDLHDISSTDTLDIAYEIVKLVGDAIGDSRDYDRIVLDVSSGLRGVAVAMVFAALAMTLFLRPRGGPEVQLSMRNYPQSGQGYSGDVISLRASSSVFLGLWEAANDSDKIR